MSKLRFDVRRWRSLPTAASSVYHAGMSEDLPPGVARLVDRAERDPDVLAVFLFGSQARGEATAGSDMDICLVLASTTAAVDEVSRVQLSYLSDFDLDIAVFQRVPLAIRSRILKEGRVLFVRDEVSRRSRTWLTAVAS